MRLSVFLCLLCTLFSLVSSLKCWSGHSQVRTTCSSLSYCVTIRPKNGVAQHACDGTGVGSISLCAQPPTRLRGGTGSEYFYSGQMTSSSSSRSRLLSQPDQTCFDGGERLGMICCCSTDLCNQAGGRSLLIQATVSLITILWWIN